MPRGFHRQWPAPSDFGIEGETQRALRGAMLRTWKDRLRAIATPDDRAADVGPGIVTTGRRGGMPPWLFKVLVLAGLTAVFAAAFHWLGDSPWQISFLYGLISGAGGVVFAGAAAHFRPRP